MKAVRDAALRRLAIQIAGQLPEETEDALAVLAYARRLVREFLAEGEPAPLRIVYPDEPPAA